MKFINWLETLFFSKIRIESLVICRIVFGLCLVFHYASLALGDHLQDIFGPEGLGGYSARAHLPNLIHLARPEQASFQLFHLVQSPMVISVLALALILTSLSFALGFFTRTSGLLALILHILFYTRNEYAYWGWGELIIPLLLYVLASPAGRWYSVDSLRRTSKFCPAPDERVENEAWPIRLMQLHVITIYVVAAWARVDDPNWLNGSMLYGILSDPIFSRFDFDWRSILWPMKIACWSSWSLELSAPFGLLYRRTRQIWVVLLIVLHVGLELLTKVGYWDFLMMAALMSYWSWSDPHPEIAKPANGTPNFKVVS